MTVGEKLSRSAIQVQEAWTSLAENWTQTVQDMVDTASVDPLAWFRPDVAMDQLFTYARRNFEINRDLIMELTGLSVTAEVAVGRGITVISTVVSEEAERAPAPIDVAVNELEAPKAEAVGSEKHAPRPVVPAKYSRVSKAELQKALSKRQLPTTGTIKELRGRLIEADRQS